MRLRKYLPTVAGMAVFLLGICGAQASTVVYEDFQTVSENTVSTTPFEVTQIGAYKAELVDFEYPSIFSILSLGITQGDTPLGFRFDTGTFTFNVTEPGTLLAHLAAIPGSSGSGTYALRIKAVPIPPAAVLLFSGMIGLVVVGRRENWMKMA